MGHQERVIRLFVSSTFADMREEREQLAKFAFPKLRKLCEERGIVWSEVDLRWGITDQQKAKGQVLDICLAEIDQCRPFFLAILGNRYGWIPEITEDLVQRYPWLADRQGCSLLELEILHGALNHPAAAGEALFYARRGAAGGEQDQGAAKLAELGGRIRESGLRFREGYTTAAELAEWVVADVAEKIERYFPTEQRYDQVYEEAAYHASFSLSRCRNYTGRAEYFERLNAHAENSGASGQVVTGEGGSGKSALLANWARRKAADPSMLVISHFTGAGPSSAAWEPMLARLSDELRRSTSLPDRRATDPSELRDDFAESLREAAARRRVVLVIDGLDQLEDRDGAPDLVWLPRNLPANIRLVVSAREGRALTELRRREWPCLTVAPLTQGERRQLITDCLSGYGKRLADELEAAVVAARGTANPLFLTALLEELRLWGDHEKLGARLGYYLAADGPAELYARILERYEEDYEADRPGLVRDAMRHIWASRRGLAEKDLLTLLGEGGECLPAAIWAPLQLSARQSLVTRSGLIGFFHDYLREAVQRRYLPADEERRAAHAALARHFAGARGSDVPRRYFDESPWQTAQAGMWEDLRELLTRQSWLLLADSVVPHDVSVYWTQLELHTPYRMVDEYGWALRPSGSIDERSADFMAVMGKYLMVSGRREATIALWEKVAECRRDTGNHASLAAALNNLGVALNAAQRREEALARYRDCEQAGRKGDDRKVVWRALLNQAGMLGDLGRPGEAPPLLDQVESEATDPEMRAECVLHRAFLAAKAGRLDEAAELAREATRQARQTENPEMVGPAYACEADVALRRGDLKAAVAFMLAEQTLYREVGNKWRLADSLRRQAKALGTEREMANALAMLEEAGNIYGELGDERMRSAVLLERASAYEDSGWSAKAMISVREAEKTAERANFLGGIAEAAGVQAWLYYRRKQWAQAEEAYGRAVGICRQHGLRRQLCRLLSFQGMVIGVELGRIEDGLAVATEALRLAEELADVEMADVTKGLLDLLQTHVRRRLPSPERRLFPALTAGVYDAATGSLEAAALLAAARRPIGLAGLAIPRGGEPGKRIARLTGLHRLILQAEMGGHHWRARWLKSAFHRVLRRSWDDEEAWKSIAPDGEEWRALRQAWIDEVVVPAEWGLVRSHTAMKTSRGIGLAVGGLLSLTKLLRFSALSAEVRLGMAGNAAADLIPALLEAKRHSESMEICREMLELFPDCEHFQEDLFRIVNVRTLRRIGTEPGRRAARAAERGIREIENLRTRYPYQRRALKDLATLQKLRAGAYSFVHNTNMVIVAATAALRYDPELPSRGASDATDQFVLDVMRDRLEQRQRAAEHYPTETQLLDAGPKPYKQLLVFEAQVYDDAREVWATIGLPPLQAYTDSRPLALHRAIRQALAERPGDEDSLRTRWKELAAADPHLNEIDHEAVVSYLAHRLLGSEAARFDGFPEPKPPALEPAAGGK